MSELSNTVNCKNCLLDLTLVNLSKIENKCPRCGCGLFDKLQRTELKDIPNSGGNTLLTRGSELIE